MQEIKIGSGACIAVKTPDGKVYEVRKPKLGEVMQYEKARKAEGADEIELLFGWLESLGLPKDVLMDMTAEDVVAVSEALAPKKK